MNRTMTEPPLDFEQRSYKDFELYNDSAGKHLECSSEIIDEHVVPSDFDEFGATKWKSVDTMPANQLNFIRYAGDVGNQGFNFSSPSFDKKLNIDYSVPSKVNNVFAVDVPEKPSVLLPTNFYAQGNSVISREEVIRRIDNVLCGQIEISFEFIAFECTVRNTKQLRHIFLSQISLSGMLHIFVHHLIASFKYICIKSV